MKTMIRSLLAAAALALCASSAIAASPPASNPPTIQTTTPNACTITQTSVSTSSTSAALLAANANRKAVRFYNIGAVAVTISPGTAAATVGAGLILSPSSQGSGTQGGSEVIADGAEATNAFQVISSSAGTVIAWECT